MKGPDGLFFFFQSVFICVHLWLLLLTQFWTCPFLGFPLLAPSQLIPPTELVDCSYPAYKQTAPHSAYTNANSIIAQNPTNYLDSAEATSS